MGGLRGQDWELDSLHANICKKIKYIYIFSRNALIRSIACSLSNTHLLMLLPALIQVKLLFAAEKKICDQILDGVESLRDQCFGEVTANSVAILLSFGEAIAKSKRSPEKLFVLLDMYEIMRELKPEVTF